MWLDTGKLNDCPVRLFASTPLGWTAKVTGLTLPPMYRDTTLGRLDLGRIEAGREG